MQAECDGQDMWWINDKAAQAAQATQKCSYGVEVCSTFSCFLWQHFVVCCQQKLNSKTIVVRVIAVGWCLTSAAALNEAADCS